MPLWLVEVFEYGVRKMHRLSTLLLWAVWTLLCSPPAWARTSADMRLHFVDGLQFMGIEIDPEKNNIRGEEAHCLPRRRQGQGSGHPHQRGADDRKGYR